MKKLSQILNEALVPKVYKNASISVIHNIASQSKYKTARFVATDDGKTVNAADAAEFCHANMYDGIHPDTVGHRGYYTITSQGPHFAMLDGNRGYDHIENHPIYDKLKKLGAKQGKYCLKNNSEGARPPRPGERLDGPLDFGESLNEELTPKLYRNIGVPALMNLAKQHTNTRFLINLKTGQMDCGAAESFLHGDMTQHYEERGDHENIRGTMSYVNGKHYYTAHNTNDEDDHKWHASKHPLLDKIEKAGAIRGLLKGDFGYQRVMPSPTKQKALSDLVFEDFDWTPSPKIKSVDIGKANIQYTVNPDNTGNIKLIGVEPRNRGKGHAKKALSQFLQTADQKKTTMFLDAVQMGVHKTALDKSGLEGFYKSVGFRRNGKVPAGEDREFIRRPR